MSDKSVPRQSDLFDPPAEQRRNPDAPGGGSNADVAQPRRTRAEVDSGAKAAASAHAAAPRLPPVNVVQDRTGDAYLSDKQVAKHYGVSRATIWRWTKEDNDFPQPVLVGTGTTRWRRTDIEFYDQHRPPAGSGRRGKSDQPRQSASPGREKRL